MEDDIERVKTQLFGSDKSPISPGASAKHEPPAKLLFPEKEEKEKSNPSKIRASFTGIKKEKDAKHPINSHLSEAEPWRREHAVV